MKKWWHHWAPIKENRGITLGFPFKVILESKPATNELPWENSIVLLDNYIKKSCFKTNQCRKKN